MNNLKEKLLHNCIMNPNKFWKQSIGILISVTVLFTSLGFVVAKYQSTESEIKEYATVYSLLEDEVKMLNYISNDSTSTKIKIAKLEAISNVKIPKTINHTHLDLMVVTAAYYDIPLRIFLRTAYKESVFNPNALSNKQAKGYFQIRDQTYNTYYKKIYIYDQTPESNIRLAGYILKSLKSKYKSWDLTLAAYNAGPAIVDSVGIPNYKETKDYIKFILL
jgi:soluble lytic murein transglycosylase-like protein